MIYAALIKKTDHAIQTPGHTILAFVNQADYDKEQDRLWSTGDRFAGENLVPITFEHVQQLEGLKIQYKQEGNGPYIVEGWQDNLVRQHNAEYYAEMGMELPRYFTADEIRGMNYAATPNA